MVTGPIGVPHDNHDGEPHEGGRLVTESEGNGGLSDRRRAELERLQAGVGPAVDASSGNDHSGTSAEKTSDTAAQQTADAGGRSTFNTGSVQRDV